MNRPQILAKLRDLWRGYSDADIGSLHEKLCRDHAAGEVVMFTAREWRALRKDGGRGCPDHYR